MKLSVGRYEVTLVPEGPTDEAYIEEVLGLRDTGDTAVCVRQNAIGLSCLGNVVIRRAPRAPAPAQRTPTPEGEPQEVK